MNKSNQKTHDNAPIPQLPQGRESLKKGHDKSIKREQCVLFVDDEMSVLEGLKLALHHAHFHKLFASSAAEGMEILSSTHVDIVVADEQMPSMTGSEFLSNVHRLYPEIIRLVLSGHASKERVIEAINSGQIQRFLTKPIDSDTLLNILSQYLSEIRLQETQDALLVRSDTLGRWDWNILDGTYCWNAGFERLMHFTPKYPQNDIIQLFGTVIPEDRNALEDTIHDCKNTGQVHEFTHRVTLPDGSVRWITQLLDVFRDKDKIWKMIGIIRDVTDHKEKEILQAERLEILERTIEKTVEALARMTEIRDPYTAGHQARVERLSRGVGRIPGLSPERLLGLEIAAKLHDIGKISIPAQILTKPGILTKPEMALIKQHPEMGFQIIRDIPFSTPVSDIVLQHPERIDGSGYPRGLKGSEIMLEARIIALADVFEAMSSFRPYRPGLGRAVALAELASKKGKIFDEEVIEAFEELLTEQPEIVENSVI